MSPAERGPRLVIFDCDGVLIDSEPIACAVQAETLAAYGYSITADEVAVRFIGKSARDMRAAIEADWGRALPDDHERRCAEALARRFRRELTPVPGMAHVVDAVAAAGLATCVASSSSPERLALSLDLAGLAERFGARVFSAALVERGKPAPDLFLYAAAALEVAPTACVVVEDSPAGVQAALAAGMRAIGFTAGRHCGPGHAARLRQAGARSVLADVEELRLALVDPG